MFFSDSKYEAKNRKIALASLFFAILLHVGIFILLKEFDFSSEQPKKQKEELELTTKLPASAFIIEPIEITPPVIPPPIPSKPKELPSIITDPSVYPQKPEKADFQSANDTLAATHGAANPDLAPLPNTEGKSKEGSLTNKTWQDGDLKKTENPSTAQSNSKPSPQSPANQKVPAQQPQTKPQNQQTPTQAEKNNDPILAEKNASQGDPKGKSDLITKTETDSPNPSEKNQNSPLKETNNPAQNQKPKTDLKTEKSDFSPSSRSVLDDLAHIAKKLNLPDPTKPEENLPSPQKHKGEENSLASLEKSNLPPKKPNPIYDPAFPGGKAGNFVSEQKTSQRRGSITRQGDNSVNAKKTARGTYENQIYQAIGQRWHRECFERRDLIVPGTLVIRIIVNPNGSIARAHKLSMENCSEIQHGFTIRAIKSAKLPPMPEELKKELNNGQMEQIFTFYF